MVYTLKLLPIVHSDLRKAKNWYSKEAGSLGEEFKKAVNKEIEYLERYPQHFQRRYKELRYALVTAFPYAIFYIIKEEDKVVILLGVLHTKRNPDFIRKRMPK